jgi:hypothetical protein
MNIIPKEEQGSILVVNSSYPKKPQEDRKKIIV